MNVLVTLAAFFVLVFFLSGIRIVRPTHRGLVERWILEAEGEAEAIRLVNEAANRYFVGNAQLLKRLETVQNALQDNAKVVVPSNAELVNVIGDLAGVLPVKTPGGP